MKKTGILGGTFNPIHNGHIELALYCAQILALDRVLIIPDYTPPHKSDSNLADSHHRLRMCELAVENLDGFEVSDIEIKRGGRSYTFQTLTELKNIYPEDELFFIMGADMFLTLDKWKNPNVIFEKASIAAVPRNDSDSEEMKDYLKKVLVPLGAKATVLQNSVIQISSTFIRENIGNEALMSDFLNSNVYSYIKSNKLYGM